MNICDTGEWMNEYEELQLAAKDLLDVVSHFGDGHITAGCQDLLDVMSHFGDGHLEDANEGTEEVGRRDCNLGLKGIETLLAYILQPTEATARGTGVEALASTCEALKVPITYFFKRYSFIYPHAFC
jgi:hypothetical protein